MSLAAEKMVLAGLLQHGKEFYYEIADKVDEDCFEASLHNDHTALFRCLYHTAKNYQEVLYTTVMLSAENLGLTAVLESQDNRDHLSILKRNTVELVDAVAASKQLRKKKILRQLSSEMRRAAAELESFTGEEPLGDILSKPSDVLSKVLLNASDDNAPKKVLEGIKERLEDLRENPCDVIGLPTPHSIYNQIIGGGLRRRCVNFIVARPKSGKTTFAKNTCYFLSKNYEIPCLMLDTEMDKEDQQVRITAEHTGLEMSDIERGRFTKETSFQMGKIADIPFYHMKVAGMPFAEILSICNRWVKTVVGRDKTGVMNDCLIVYDYFKLMDESHKGGMKEYEAIGYQLDKLKTFVNVNDVSCLSFTQANREDDVSQSDRINWFASSVCFLEEKSIEEISADGGPKNGNVKIRSRYCRYGGGLDQGDYISLDFDKKRSRMKEVDTRFNLAKAKGNHGFDTTDADPDDEDT